MKRKLNYRFHNPNTVEKTADALYNLFLEVNAGKVDRMVREAVEKEENESLQKTTSA
jgi:hypothetical protein